MSRKSLFGFFKILAVFVVFILSLASEERVPNQLKHVSIVCRQDIVLKVNPNHPGPFVCKYDTNIGAHL